MRLFLLLTLIPLLTIPVSAQTPAPDRIVASNFCPGCEAGLTAYGKGFKDLLYLWTPVGNLPYSPEEKPSDTIAHFDGKIPADVTPGVYETRIVSRHGVSGRNYLVLDDLPTFTPPDRCEVNPPTTVCPNMCCLNGYMNALKPRFFGIALKQGQKLTVEVFARRLNSPLDPVLRLINDKGREIAFADDTPGLAGDALLSITAPVDGTYTLELRDVQYSGGNSHYFHLRIGGFDPVQGSLPRRTIAGSDIRLLSDHADSILVKTNSHAANMSVPVAAKSEFGSSLSSVVTTSVAPIVENTDNDTKETAMVIPADAGGIAGQFEKSGDVDWYRISVETDAHLCITAHTQDVGSPVDAVLQLQDSTGKQLQESDDAETHDAQLSLSLSKGDYFLLARELSGQGGPSWTYDLDLQRFGRLELSTATDSLGIPKGGAVTLPVNIRQLGPARSFTLQPLNLPDGLVAAPVIVTEKQKTAHIILQCAADAAEIFHHRLSFEARVPGSSETFPVLYRPAPPKNGPNFQLPRIDGGIFAHSTAAAAFNLTPRTTQLQVAQGSSVQTVIIARRSGDWNQPIELTSTIPTAELPDGITVESAKLEKEQAAVVIKTSSKTPPGQYTLSLHGTLKKDKTTIVQPVPTVRLIVTAAD